MSRPGYPAERNRTMSTEDKPNLWDLSQPPPEPEKPPRSRMPARQLVFEIGMWVITLLALAVLLGGLVAALWTPLAWATYGKAALTVAIGWPVLATVLGMTATRSNRWHS